MKNASVAVREWNEKIIFLRRIVPGAADKSYGIQVARLAGLPQPIIDRAKQILTHLESTSRQPEDGGAAPVSPTAAPRSRKAASAAAVDGPVSNQPELMLF